MSIVTIARLIVSPLRLSMADLFEHLEAVATLATDMAMRLGWFGLRLAELQAGALLHDIGKAGLSRDLLWKPTPLSWEEVRDLRRHVEIGAEFIKDINEVMHLADYALYHHERPDGSGYPVGLCDSRIPDAVILVGMADHYTAMRSFRTYRAAFDVRTAIEITESSFAALDGRRKGFLEHFRAAVLAMESQKKERR